MSEDSGRPSAAPGSLPYCSVAPDALDRASGLAPVTLRYAYLFDGRLTPAERLRLARERYGEVSDWALEHAALDLAIAGLLEPGHDEPLPAPGQLEIDPWGQAAHPRRRDTVPLPTLLAGTLAQPGLPGAIAGNFSTRLRGAPDPVETELAPAWFNRIGVFFAAPALHPRLALAVLLLAGGGLVAMWNIRLEVARDALHLFDWTHLLTVLAVAILVNMLVTQSARLAAIRRCTGQWPSFGLKYALGFLPQLFTSTAGVAERADQRERGVILAAPMLALLLLILLAEFGWFMTRQGPGVLPQYFVGQIAFSLVPLLFGANPLVRRDGYHWLANRIGAPDLRDQAWISLFGRDRPWNERAPLPVRVRYLYAGLSIAYLLVVFVVYLMFPARLLERHLGGPGIALFLSVFLFGLYRQSRRGLYFRASLEPFRVKLPTLSRTHRIILGAAAAVFVLPYPYEPSGTAVVLPHDRAEVRALVAGDVKEVLVHEGDLVTAGQELLVISDVQARAEAAAAEATLRRAQAELSIVKTGGAAGEVQLAREKLATARKRMEFAQAEADRLAKAYQRKAVSPQEYDTARGAAAVRRQEAMEAEQQVKVIGNPARDERISALQAEVIKAETELTYHKEQLDNTHVRAPIAGRVVSDQLLFARGRYLTVGAPIALIEDTGKLQAEIALPESTVGKVTEGASAWLRVWAFPGGSFDGKVIKVAPDAEKGEYGKIVRVRVELEDGQGKLKPEMTGEAKVRSHWTIAGLAFTRALVRFVLVEVWSWLP